MDRTMVSLCVIKRTSRNVFPLQGRPAILLGFLLLVTSLHVGSLTAIAASSAGGQPGPSGRAGRGAIGRGRHLVMQVRGSS
jgi:hypothetical protein